MKSKWHTILSIAGFIEFSRNVHSIRTLTNLQHEFWTGFGTESHRLVLF